MVAKATFTRMKDKILCVVSFIILVIWVGPMVFDVFADETFYEFVKQEEGVRDQVRDLSTESAGANT